MSRVATGRNRPAVGPLGATLSPAGIAAQLRVQGPSTQTDLTDELRFLGVGVGDIVLVHSSLRSLGFVVGGAQAVAGALLDAVGPTGTVVVPTHSDPWSEPTHWSDVPDDWADLIRANTPAYNPRVTPTTHMGAIVECLRRWPGFLRSWHPRVSFGAIGPHAEALLSNHALASGFGERSPLARLYDANGKILLLGVCHDRSSALHLAEHRAMYPTKRWITQGAALRLDGEVDGAATWTSWRELDGDASDFAEIGRAIDASGIEQVGWVASATGRLMPLRDAVDLAVDWIAVNRTGG